MGKTNNVVHEAVVGCMQDYGLSSVLSVIVSHSNNNEQDQTGLSASLGQNLCQCPCPMVLEDELHWQRSG